MFLFLLWKQVNVVCTKLRGEPKYEIIKPIAADQELVVYYLPERPEELFFFHMRSAAFGQRVDEILEGKWSKLLKITMFFCF